MAGSELPSGWLSTALDPPRAFGAPPVTGIVRASPEDFIVDEELGFTPEGDGPHWLLRVRKRDANTEFVAGVLARSAGVRTADVGFAGLKDRHAIATQWFSVPRGKTSAEQWLSHRLPEFEVLEAHAHRRKLARGALAGNRFTLRVREVQGNAAALLGRLDAVGAQGIPNYFGAQRFGREANNLRLAWLWSRGQAPRSRSDRSFALSAARSLIFNAVLAARVESREWSTLRPGDVANLDGSASVFAVAEVDEVLVRRVRELDVHPTGPLWGTEPSMAAGEVLALERKEASAHAPLTTLLENEGLRQERRSLRIRVAALTTDHSGDTLVLGFHLPAGAFATTVLRELIVEPRSAP